MERVIAQRVLKMSFLVAFVGWIMIWIMLPTKTYKNIWTPYLDNKLNSSYFADQVLVSHLSSLFESRYHLPDMRILMGKTKGTNLLLFTFPVMFIAAFGCIYLHLKKNSEKPKLSPRYELVFINISKTDDLILHGVLKMNMHGTACMHRDGKCVRLGGFWKRPAVVMAPLGVVSAIELVFGVMFITLLIWSLSNYLYVSFGQLHNHDGAKVWQAKFRSVSLRLGYVGNICWAFLFFPVTRGSSILPLVGLTSESSIKYHIWLGHISSVLFVAHT
ncbi:hypothetical protein CRG98_016193, partial [Punica granatum]